jgi:hypothetical protein
MSLQECLHDFARRGALDISKHRSAQIFLNGPVVAPVTLMNDFLVYRRDKLHVAAREL